MNKYFNPITKFFSYNNPQDPRLGDLTKPLTKDSDLNNSIVILGYPDDEGINNNFGRVGAREAPKKIREYFYKMTPHLLRDQDPKLFDLGDFSIEGSLIDRHQNAKESLKNILDKTRKIITLGGGHDYGYPDGAAFLEVFKDQKPLVINFDAHLDVRPLNDKITSGTPFFRLLTDYRDFDFLEIGIQSQCNSRHHLKWAESKNAHILTFDEIMYSGRSQATKILEFLEPFLLKKRACFISLDIDAFSNAYAPGCSQSFATGFDPENFFKVYKILNERLDVRLVGIYEVSPAHDQDNKTSKLAAQVMFESL